MDAPTCQERIDSHLESRAEDFTCFMNGETTCTIENGGYEDSFEEFANYGLSFGFSYYDEIDEDNPGYYTYLLSWGGPSDEIRFHSDGM